MILSHAPGSSGMYFFSRSSVFSLPLSSKSKIEEYARNVPDQLGETRIAQINKAGRNIYFAWSRGTNRGDPRYYRVQPPSFLIEFDDTQDVPNPGTPTPRIAGFFEEAITQRLRPRAVRLHADAGSLWRLL
jgi:hypothetical protein